MIKIVGYDLFGRCNEEGIRYAWGGELHNEYIESAAFVNRSKGRKENICGYTTSVSAGCILQAMGVPCTFCRTGNLLPFGGRLTYKEIAKQNVFMVLTDMYCDDHPELAVKMREFAYMGQGEPGLSYDQVRMAIELTNRVMRQLGQTVYRHVFATCGIPQAIYRYKEDVKNYYTEKVTLHLSLHALDRRDAIMPVNTIYPICEAVNAMRDIVDITGEKPCVGIMLFSHFSPKGYQWDYTNSVENVMRITGLLDADRYRLSFCEYNSSDEMGVAEEYPKNMAEQLLEMVRKQGFEAKLFSSFGQDKKAACGMLGGKEPEAPASEKWKKLDDLAERLIEENI